MEESSPRIPRRKSPHEASPSPTTATGGCSRRSKGRFAAVDDGGDLTIECSGKYCRSCTAGMIADCVAVCCCPCAVLHCFALAFVKAPWMMGRRCLGLGKKKRMIKKKKNKDQRTKLEQNDVVLERNHQRGKFRKGMNMVEMVNSGLGIGETEEIMGFEVAEMYEIGHLGFFHRELD